MKMAKKILSIVLVVIMFMTAVPIESFAGALDWIRPFIYKVEFVDGNPLSNNYIQKDNDMLDVDKAYIMPTDDIYNYILRLYFSNGRTVEISPQKPEGSDMASLVSSVDMVMILDTAECQKATYMGEGIVDVKIDLVVNYLYGTPKEYSFKTQKPIVNQIVSNVRLIESMPYNYNTEWPYDDFVGKKFEVTYANGTKEILTFRNNSYYYGLEGTKVELRYGENKYIDKYTGELVYYKGLDIFFVDSFFPVERKNIPCPYKSLKVTDYELDGEGGLESIKFTLTYNNGKTVKKVGTFNTPLVYGSSQVIGKLDGYDVTVTIDSKDEDQYSIKTQIGYDIWEIESEVSGDFSDFCDCKCHKTGWLRKFFHSIRNAFWKLFKKNEICQCGIVHWTKADNDKEDTDKK